MKEKDTLLIKKIGLVFKLKLTANTYMLLLPVNLSLKTNPNFFIYRRGWGNIFLDFF